MIKILHVDFLLMNILPFLFYYLDNFKHGFFQPGIFNRFEQIPSDSKFHSRLSKIKLGKTGNNYVFRIGFTFEVPDHFNPVQTGHDNISKYNVRLQSCYQFFTFNSVFRFSNNFTAVFKPGSRQNQTFTENLLIFNNNNAEHLHTTGSVCILRVIVVSTFPALSISKPYSFP